MTAAQWHVSVDTAQCDGTGLCVGRAPELFEIGPDRRTRVLHATVEPGEAVVDAAECCPMEAIRVVDASTGRLLHPEDL